MSTRLAFFFFQAEDGIRDLVRSRGLGDVYKRQVLGNGERLIVHHRRLVGHIGHVDGDSRRSRQGFGLSLIHI